MKLIRTTRPKRLFYARYINMAYSFDSLMEMAGEMLGAEPEVGDIIVVDNKNQDKRKMFQVTKFGAIIHYARMTKGQTFAPLAENNGLLKNVTKEIM